MFLSNNGTHFKNDEAKLSQELLKLNIEWKYFIEAIYDHHRMINSRPPGYVYTDDVHKILTPLHLIYSRRIYQSNIMMELKTHIMILLLLVKR